MDTNKTNINSKTKNATHIIKFHLNDEEYQIYEENKKKFDIKTDSRYCKMRCLQLVDSIPEPLKMQVADALEEIREQVYTTKETYPSVYRKVNQGCKDVIELVSGKGNTL